MSFMILFDLYCNHKKAVIKPEHKEDKIIIISIISHIFVLLIYIIFGYALP